ncbi:hypothetical protein J7K28_09035 [Candidatus Aerophobetes bacterium]|nr:hypothetical protein [Candidatus Aerophobetes bacterium]
MGKDRGIEIRMNSRVIVFDCGSTNLRVAAVDIKGNILAQQNYNNAPVKQNSTFLIWDVENIWNKLTRACRRVCASIGQSGIKGVIVTTWGGDGAPVDKNGHLTYPVISWQCLRGREEAKEILKKISARDIFKITGYQIIPFNTLLRIMWLKKNAPASLDKAKYWLMMPGLINFKLSGKFSIDPTIASTTMGMDLGRRRWSERMLALAGIDSSFFPSWIEPGKIIGEVTPQASRECNLPRGIPVVSGGHDTEFAVIGSRISQGEVLVSSGSWEIPIFRVDKFNPQDQEFEEDLLFEADVLPGWWNPQSLVPGSLILEWVRKNFFGEIKENVYKKMILEGEKVRLGSGKIILIPSFIPYRGPYKRYNLPGVILGLKVDTNRSQIYRAALEGLSFQLRKILEGIIFYRNLKVEKLKVVGGGSKNRLWNQIKADVSGIPVVTLSQEEATVMGAAIVAFSGIGVFSSIEEAQKSMVREKEVFKPSSQNHFFYEETYQKYLKLTSLLGNFYEEKS